MCSIVRKTWLNLKSDTWLLYHYKINGLIKTFLELGLKLKAKAILSQARKCTSKREQEEEEEGKKKGEKKTLGIASKADLCLSLEDF